MRTIAKVDFVGVVRDLRRNIGHSHMVTLQPNGKHLDYFEHDKRRKRFTADSS